MNAAAAARLAKEKHPERYCPEPKCLWRVQSFRWQGDQCLPIRKPCPKHMKPVVSPSTPGAA